MMPCRKTVQGKERDAVPEDCAGERTMLCRKACSGERDAGLEDWRRRG